MRLCVHLFREKRPLLVSDYAFSFVILLVRLQLTSFPVPLLQIELFIHLQDLNANEMTALWFSPAFVYLYLLSQVHANHVVICLVFLSITGREDSTGVLIPISVFSKA